MSTGSILSGNHVIQRTDEEIAASVNFSFPRFLRLIEKHTAQTPTTHYRQSNRPLAEPALKAQLVYAFMRTSPVHSSKAMDVTIYGDSVCATDEPEKPTKGE